MDKTTFITSKTTEPLVKRNSYLKQIRPFMGKDIVKVITGLRRCGKSAMLSLIIDELLASGIKAEDILSLNFEDLENAPLSQASSLDHFIRQKLQNKTRKTYLFFDEIQEVKQWEKCVNSLRVSCNVDIYLTGSNAKLLSGELATYLAGRYVEIRIYPFSFSEFRSLLQSEAMANNIRDDFKLYIKCGGMPFLKNLHFEEASSRQYLKDIYNSVVLKDILQRGNIREADLLERIMLYLIENIGQTFSANSLSRFLKNEKRKPAPETLLNYIKAAENALILQRVKRQDIEGKKILSINEKFYISDHGISQALCGSNGMDINLILENIVYMELLRRGFSLTVGRVQEKEIDFVAEKEGQLSYFQVAYLLASPETIEREFTPLKLVKDNYPKYVLSLDEFDFSRAGIIHKNLQDWLLEDDQYSAIKV
jgi:predicted AAA+ superfamily ATPase